MPGDPMGQAGLDARFILIRIGPNKPQRAKMGGKTECWWSTVHQHEILNESDWNYYIFQKYADSERSEVLFQSDSFTHFLSRTVKPFTSFYLVIYSSLPRFPWYQSFISLALPA